MQNFKHINIDYLNEMSEGSDDLKKDLICMFIRQVPVFSEQLDKYYLEKDYLSLGKLAHKIKSSVAMMGIAELTDGMKYLEINAKDGLNVSEYPEYIQKFKTISSEAIIELNEILTQIIKNKTI